MEDDVAVRVAGQRGCARDLDAAEVERHPGPERVAVVTDARPRPARPGQDHGGSLQIARQRHLEVARIAWYDMDRDATGFEQGGLVGERREAARREAPLGRAEQVPSHALRRLRRPEPGPVDRRPDAVAVDPLERLGDGHDRDRRAVSGGGGRDRRDERRLDQWPGRVVDEHDPGRVGGVAVEGREPGVDRLLAALAAGDDLDDCAPAASSRPRPPPCDRWR